MWKRKQVSCENCFKIMRSDNLKRHKKVHQKSGDTTNLDKKGIIQWLIKNEEEYAEKFKLGEMIYKNVIEYGIQEASIPIEYQEPLEIYMKGNKTDESGINSNQSEITLLEDTLLGDTILKDTTAATVLKIYKLLQRMTNKNV